MKLFLVAMTLFSSSLFASGLGTTVCHEISSDSEKSTFLITEKEHGFTYEEQINHKKIEKAELSRDAVTFDNRSGVFFTFLNQPSNCSENLSVTLMTNDELEGDLGIKSSKSTVATSVKCKFFPLDDEWAQDNR